MVRYAPDGLIGLLQWFLAGHRKWESAPGPTVAKEGQP
jgi:hypothetical protein